MRVNLTVNGRPMTADDVWEGESLLYVLRERLGLPGAKNACEQGECGSCTIYLDGAPVCACLVAAGQAEGREVVTVEGLAGAAGGPHGELRAGPDGERDGERDGGPGGGLNRGPDSGLTEVQRAFADAGAVQCGFCTPGLVVQAHALLADGDGVPPDADIREALAGNLCRCTGYEKILDAVRLAAARRHPHPPP
ncbi:(2Fe-2S)-binding protein [Microbispora bryophytorum]|uniref:(2Fe-2S)-binding protein n=1 Tax=Microbispora bryophytorum subsp. camponoti TaxID=1677852 RepID=A0ABR8KZ01_9ACTN|nr:(2Fe-2S)-binding protein [Microbispora camponoti]MBD3142699.1 (2Fe-2S)-binding protein [Microbispora camponoti]